VPIDPRAWIDPSVVEKVGITPAELAAYTHPDAYSGEGGTVKQPPYDPAKPHQAYPEAMYKAMIAAPDEVLLKATKFEPPVKVMTLGN